MKRNKTKIKTNKKNEQNERASTNDWKKVIFFFFFYNIDQMLAYFYGDTIKVNSRKIEKKKLRKYRYFLAFVQKLNK